MSDMESRVAQLEAWAYETRADARQALDELTTKVDKVDFEVWRDIFSRNLSDVEVAFCKIMKFLEENWGITNVDDLI